MSVDAAMLPWHSLARERMAAALASERLPHAVLLHGPEGVGKDRFAGALAAAFLCSRRSPSLEPCGECGDCALTRAGSHPDLYWLRRPEDRKSISVDQVREACEQLAMTSMRRGFRILIAVPAHIMTVNAQNALLKTLEEPSPRTLIILVTDRPSGLLATLRSRCQRVEVARPDAATALQWLQEATGAPAPMRLLDIAGGAPLKALMLAPHFEALERQMAGSLEALVSGRSDVVGVAAEMMGEGLPVRLDWLELWLGAVVRQRLAADATHITLPGGDLLQRAARAVNINACFKLLDRVRETRRLLEGSAAAQLVIESLLVDCARALGGRGVSG